MSSEKPPLAPETSPPSDTAFFGHPSGLSTLFFTEMWERFSYYGMRAILILFMTHPVAEGALGFSDSKAGLIYGLYTGIVYVLSLPGGWIADRFLGQRKAVLYGGVGIMFGHLALTVPTMETFYLGLVLIALGTGLLKPNISTIVGQLYTPEDKRRDSGFSIYYMGINLGATTGQIVVGPLLAQSETFQRFLASVGLPPSMAWHFAFGAAALGMFIGIVQYVLGGRRLGTAGLLPTPPESPAAAAKSRRLLWIILASLVGAPALVGGLAAMGVPITADHIRFGTLGLLLALGLGLFVAMFKLGTWSTDERKRLWVILLLFFGAIFFFAVFEQAGSTFNLFADRNTRNEIFGWSFGSSTYQTVNSVFVILLSPVFAWLWLKLEKRPHPTSGPTKKFGSGLLLLGIGCLAMLPAAQIAATGAKAGPGWLINLYFIHTCAELCLSPVGLSWTTRLAPPRIAGLAMGIWFTGIAIGNYLAGIAAGLTESMSLTQSFLLSAIAPIGAGLVFFLLVGPVRKLLVKE
jgi:POT family proton-dependent oligopeptide transporter